MGGQPGIGGSSRSRSPIEGSLLLTVVGSLDTEQSRRGGKGRGDHESTGKGDGGCYGRASRGDSGGE